ncbi:PASTA domain-containing protein [Bacteroidia bacterium]|nr:PASTA domain-containing protein [Bacteroidia bacterium]MDC1395157.1 PASTA domain-containing protein [Bacteroidia bacterium]
MKKIAINLGIMIAIIVVLAFGALSFLGVYTKHGSPLVEVENLEGVRAHMAISSLAEMGLEGIVTDTVYKDGVKKLAVINQNPYAGQNVKKGRKVYLVINTEKVPMVEVPDLAEKTSLPQATNILLRKHLKVGKIIKQVNASVKTRNDEPVLAQYEAGTTTKIAPGTKIERNSSIDLVVGISFDYYIPDTTATQQSPEIQ